MSFAHTAALAWLALALPIVIFYILKIRLRRVPVSTILFWQQIFEEKQPRSIWQRLRHLLSLLVQLAMLLLLALALAEPFFTWEITQSRRLVLVLDNSASMRAADVAPSRFEQAKQLARRSIAALRARDEMAIVAAGAQPRVACGLSSHQRTLRQALDAIEPSDGPTSAADAVALARRLLSGGENGRVVLISDGCFEGAAALAEAKDVELVAVGARSANVGITRFQVRRSLLDPIGYEILAEVQNASESPAACRLELDLDDNVVDVVPLDLQPGEVWVHVFEKTSAEGGVLAARLEHDDALASDNRAWAILPRREMLPVTLVSQGNLFLEKVFEANPLVKLTIVKQPPAKTAPGAITVFHRQTPERLPGGLVWVIDPAGSCDRWQAGDKLENPIVTTQDKDSPLMAHVRLDNVIMPEARKLAFAEPPQVLVGAVTGEPLYAYFARGDDKLLVLTVNLDQGDLPLRTAFPIMASNVLAWFAGHRGELRESLATGAIAEIDLSARGLQQPGAGDASKETPGAGLFSLVAPSGRSRELPRGVAQTTVGPLDECGVWRIAAAEAQSPPPTAALELACNLANRQESDVRRPEALLERNSAAPAVAGWMVRPAWFYLIALGWLLTAAEWYLYQRRWIS